jgi:hypothetical protein
VAHGRRGRLLVTSRRRRRPPLLKSSRVNESGFEPLSVATIHARLASGWLARLYREGVEPSGSSLPGLFLAQRPKTCTTPAQHLHNAQQETPALQKTIEGNSPRGQSPPVPMHPRPRYAAAGVHRRVGRCGGVAGGGEGATADGAGDWVVPRKNMSRRRWRRDGRSLSHAASLQRRKHMNNKLATPLPTYS